MNVLWSILISVSTSSAAIALWQLVLSKIFSSGVDSYFAKKLESHKHQLDQITERNRFDYDRWATDFGLYTSKKHEVYSELYRLILIADGSLEGLVGLRELPSFEEYTRNDMEQYLKGYHVVEGYILELLKDWSINRRDCIAKIREYLYMLDFQKADKDRQDAKNFFLVNILYLSNVMEKHVTELFTKLVERFVLEKHMIIDKDRDKDFYERSKDAATRKKELLKLIKEKMREELSVGYYKSE